MARFGTVVPYFVGSKIVEKLWQTLNFASDLRTRLSMATPHILNINLAGTEGAILAGFAPDWEDPRGDPWEVDRAPTCLEPNVQIQRELRAEGFEEISAATAANPPRQVRELAGEICFAFGVPEPLLFARR